MPTPSIRLSESLYRTVKASEYSISALAREGIEQVVADDFVSICWLCGGAIPRNSRREWLNQDRLLNDIADSDIPDPDIPVGEFDYQKRVREMRRRFPSEAGPDEEFYYYRAAQWFNLPGNEMPVEFCAACSSVLDQLRTREIPIADIPVPYQYRPLDTEDESEEPEFWGQIPGEAYAAEAAAVWHTDYSSFMKFHCNPNQIKGLFWWAARNRANGIVGSDDPPWLEIALRSNAHCMIRGIRLQPLWEMGKSVAENLDEGYPGSGPPPKLNQTHLTGREDACPACRTVHFDRYCPACFYSEETCKNGCGRLTPIIRNGWNTDTEVVFGCPECKHEESISDFGELFWDRYANVAEEVSRVVP